MAILEEAIARPRGRRVPELPLHEFKDSGYTCRLHRLSPMTLQRLLEAVRREAKAKAPGEIGAFPNAPVELIAVGGGDQLVAEENTTDPDYVVKLEAWHNWAMEQANNRFLRIAAVDACVWGDEFDQEAIDRFKRRMAIEGAPLTIPDGYSEEDHDRIIWLFYFCFGSNVDVTEFYSALTERSAAQPAQVEAEIATFRPAE